MLGVVDYKYKFQWQKVSRGFIAAHGMGALQQIKNSFHVSPLIQMQVHIRSEMNFHFIRYLCHETSFVFLYP